MIPKQPQPAPPNKAIPRPAVVASTAAVASTMDELEVLIRARYPLLYVITWEEQRVIADVTRIGSRLGKAVFEWSVNTGLAPTGTSAQSQKHRDAATQDPLVALDNVIGHVDPALYVFKDFHPFLKRENMAVIRRLREVAFALKNTYKTIVMTSPILEIPPELEKDLTIVDFDLPKESHFITLLGHILAEVRDNPKIRIDLDPKSKEQIVHALLGLTLTEAENVLAKALVQNKGLSDKGLEVINHEKRQIIRKNGLLEYYDAEETFESVGGLEALKEWLGKRSAAFSEQARQFGLPSPRGILLLGVQGCGKSLVAKTISSLWRMPLLRFDVGRVFGSLVGSSEQNIRRAIQVAQSISPVVFWVDEIDKAFRGSRASGGDTDGGTSSRVFSTFLTWLSEKKSPVFVVATANDVTMLPPELLRKGRFDEIFFVDLPLQYERKEILRVHLAKRKLDPTQFNLDALALASSGFSGAEIEEAIVSAMFDAFYDKQQVTTERVLTSLQQTVPLSKTMSEDVENLRKWAAGRARPATRTDGDGEADEQHRKLEI